MQRLSFDIEKIGGKWKEHDYAVVPKLNWSVCVVMLYRLGGNSVGIDPAVAQCQRKFGEPSARWWGCKSPRLKDQQS
jgi:hypothetical protein